MFSVLNIFLGQLKKPSGLGLVLGEIKERGGREGGGGGGGSSLVSDVYNMAVQLQSVISFGLSPDFTRQEFQDGGSSVEQK